jgi:transmembrane sensor
VPRLVRAMTLHPDDPRAPLAAFTLARVHLEELGAPREAARAFARARELAPNGPLAEDALAREVEAWSRAGETETAHARAVEYTQRYPAGRRLRAVRKFGGLDRP